MADEVRVREGVVDGLRVRDGVAGGVAVRDDVADGDGERVTPDGLLPPGVGVLPEAGAVVGVVTDAPGVLGEREPLLEPGVELDGVADRDVGGGRCVGGDWSFTAT